MAAPLSPTHYPWSDQAAGRLGIQARHWLFRPGALTAGLRTLGTVQLRVTREFSTGLTRMDSMTLGLTPGSPVWVREVIMAINGVDCVSARSITPLPAANGVWSGMRRLNTRPLADMLYGDRDITRSAFSWRQLGHGDPFWYAVRRHVPRTALGSAHNLEQQQARPALLARQSIFWRRRQPLLVQECFLPGFWTIARKA